LTRADVGIVVALCVVVNPHLSFDGGFITALSQNGTNSDPSGLSKSERELVFAFYVEHF
jgi:hypothetical protein